MPRSHQEPRVAERRRRIRSTRARDALAGDRLRSRVDRRPASVPRAALQRRSRRRADARCPARAPRPGGAASSSVHCRSASTIADRRFAAVPRSACRSCRPRCVSTFSSRSSASALLDEHAFRRAAAGADHDRHRRREPERARARDDQHGDAADQRVREPRLGPDRAPAGERDDRDARRPPARTTRRSDRRAAEPARACAALRRPCCTICASSVSLPDALGLHDDDAGAVDGAARHAAARLLLDGHRLAGHHRLVDERCALR